MIVVPLPLPLPRSAAAVCPLPPKLPIAACMGDHGCLHAPPWAVLPALPWLLLLLLLLAPAVCVGLSWPPCCVAAACGGLTGASCDLLLCEGAPAGAKGGK